MWTYNNVQIQDTDIPEQAIGFIYIITHTPSSRKYIGRKLLTMAGTKQVNGKKKKIRKDSKWRDYWSSSPDLLKLIATEGIDNFTREIICFANSKSSLSYMEEAMQYQLGVLETEHWFNSNIRAKVYRRNVFGKSDIIVFREMLTKFGR